MTSSVTGFSFFGAGGDDDTNPLPVELISFSGICEEGHVNLQWQTASEFNSAYFDIQYSRDGQEWNVIDSQTAMGISNSLTSYHYTHKQANSVNNYYRLNQVDIDGAFHSYSDFVVDVNCEDNAASFFTALPNPSLGNFSVQLKNSYLEGESDLSITDTKGMLVLGKQVQINYKPSEVNFNVMLNAINSSGSKINDMKIIETKLEDVFLQLTQK